MNDKDQKTVDELCQLEEEFYIPSYQRGYRWTEREVEQLLEDLSQHNDSEHGYCLQPLILKQENRRLEVIDGQQRLTTLLLILKEVSDTHSFRLTYAKYDNSQLDLNSPEIRSDLSIDGHHLRIAQQTIQKYLEDTEAKSKLKEELLRARVIWHESTFDNAHALKSFLDINSAKIPLTSAELLKALFLRGEGTQEIAYQWEAIERQLNNQDLWSFLTTNSDYNREGEARINWLFDHIAEAEDANYKHSPLRAYFYYSKQASMEYGKAWELVLDTFDRALEWFNDRDTYHKIAFMQWRSSTTVSGYLRDFEKKAKSDFRKHLTEQCKNQLENKSTPFEKLNYEDHSKKIMKLLLWFNIQATPAHQRFPFRRFLDHKWSLEHIHAQNSQAPTNDEDWKSYLQDIEPLLPNLEESVHDKVKKLLKDLEKQPPKSNTDEESREKKKIREQIIDQILNETSEENDVHSRHALSNLALLDGKTNSSLNNYPFSLKRKKLFEAEQNGALIPVATMRAFNKYYSDLPSKKMNRWTLEDKDSYLEAIIKAVNQLFNSKGTR